MFNTKTKIEINKTTQEICNLLQKVNINFKFTEHEPTITSRDAAKVRNVDLKTGAKAMIAKSNEEYILLVLPGNCKINWKKLKNLFGVKDIFLAPIEEVENFTGLVRGAIPPFGNIFSLKTYFDSKVLENKIINFNAGSVNHSISMMCRDLVKIVNPKIIDFADNELTLK